MTDSLDNASDALSPEVGMGATQVLWGGRHPMTITDVRDHGRTVICHRDKLVEYVDEDSGENVIAFEPDYDTPRLMFTLRRGNIWVASDSPTAGASRIMELGHPDLPTEMPEVKKKKK